MRIHVIHKDPKGSITDIAETDMPYKQIEGRHKHMLACTRDRLREIDKTLKDGGTVLIRRK